MMAGEVKSERLMSLDALRGADMLFIMGFSKAVVAACALLGFGGCWLSQEMSHVAWHGFNHHDTIFPLFLFLAGVSWPFSLAGQQKRGRTARQILAKIGFRVLALFLLGMVTARFFTFQVAEYRYDSVLFHIGVCWAAAALLYLWIRDWRTRLAIAAALLVIHWALLYFIPAPDAASLLGSTDPSVAKKVAEYAAYGTGNFSFTGNLAGWVDRTFMPGRLYEGVFDPDGLLAKLSGTVTAMLGAMAGELLRRREISGNRKTLVLLAAGAAALALVFIWQPWCPVNKKIWTSTFVLAAASYSFFTLALFYWIIDVKGWRGWTFFFRVIGLNSITIYVLMKFVGFRGISEFFFSGIAGLGNADWKLFTLMTGQVLIEWLLLWFLYRKQTFLKV